MPVRRDTAYRPVVLRAPIAMFVFDAQAPATGPVDEYKAFGRRRLDGEGRDEERRRIAWTR